MDEQPNIATQKSHRYPFPMRAILTSTYRVYFLGGLLIFLITACMSEGFYHPDEHFQLLEFCNYKLGNSPASDLPWEFHEQMRPTLQPVLAMGMIKTLQLLHINNPFTYALILRIVSALLAWFVVSKLCLYFLRDFTTESGKKVFLFLCYFLWFIPLISVRFSSENYAAITFLAALYLLLRDQEHVSSKSSYIPMALAGLLLGFSFYFRFQMAFAILGLGLWLLFVRKLPVVKIAVLSAAGILAAGICTGIDSWFYGDFVITPYQYFFANIVEDRAAYFGVEPWWYYFNYIFFQAIPPISILLIGFFFWGAIKRPKNVLLWCLVPFVLAHFAVGHKELRFLFPVVFLFLYLVATGVDAYIRTGKYTGAARVIAILLLVVNTPVLVFKMLTPAQEAVSYYHFLYSYAQDKNVTLVCNKESIYNIAELHINFYESPRVQCLVLENDSAITEYLSNTHPSSLHVFHRTLAPDKIYPDYVRHPVYCLFPDWVLRIHLNNWQRRARIWTIEELKREGGI